MFEGAENNFMSRGYLLPEGCKDLIDVLNLHHKEQSLEPYFLPKLPKLFPGLQAKPDKLKQPSPQSLTHEITVPAQITVSELAILLGQKPFKIIADLMEFGVFANVMDPLDFEVVSKIAMKYGFTVSKSA